MSLNLMSVLQVEDNPDDAEQFIRRLQESVTKFIVNTVNSVAAAKAALAEAPYDVIAIDINLPDSQDVSAIEELSAVSTAIIVVMTGDDNTWQVSQASNAGGDRFIRKEFLTGKMFDDMVRCAKGQRERYFREQGKLVSRYDLVSDEIRNSVKEGVDALNGLTQKLNEAMKRPNG